MTGPTPRPRSVGMTYEGEPGKHRDELVPWCVVHAAYEMMFHTCAGGPGEPLGYCAKAPTALECRFVADRRMAEEAGRRAFEQRYAAACLLTVADLHYHGRYGETCDCGEPECEGWAMGHQHEDALMEDALR